MKTGVSVCICTFRRPEPLKALLQELDSDPACADLDTTIVVVDNDPDHGAREVVSSCRRSMSTPVILAHEPVPNISLARNRAVSLSEGQYLAFIDDDEIPCRGWLTHHLKVLQDYGVDGVLGPVLSRSEKKIPVWLERSGLLDRGSSRTGTSIVNPSEMRTGNVFLKREVALSLEGPFDPGYGRTGGEDVDFFRRALSRGHTFVWCQEALVWEIIGAERLTRRYYLRRALLRGVVNARRTRLVSRGAFKSLVAAFLYTLFLPLALLMGEGVFMRFLVKNFDHIGKILALMGIRVVKERAIEDAGFDG